MADVIQLGKAVPKHRIPVIVTHDSDRHIRIPQHLLWKDYEESWFEYSRRLWVGVYEANDTDEIPLTVHLKLSESDRMMWELNQWSFHAGRVDGGILIPEVDKRLAGLLIHGIKFKLDLPE